MDETFSYKFNAIRGLQTGKEYFVVMCPLRIIPKFFIIDVISNSFFNFFTPILYRISFYFYLFDPKHFFMILNLDLNISFRL